MKCLHPLYEKVFDRSSSQDLKSDSIITFYWIVAQSTPVVRGGSALAKIVLEYLSAKAEIELPHLKQGTDLWAEAATQTLDSFKQKFKQEAYFDKAATSREILDWHAEKAGAKKAMSR
jgi:hypothetical protein